MKILIVDDAAVNVYILERRNDPALRGIPFVLRLRETLQGKGIPV